MSATLWHRLQEVRSQFLERNRGELNGRCHRLRQSSIDVELLDVISGVEAPSKGRAPETTLTVDSRDVLVLSRVRTLPAKTARVGRSCQASIRRAARCLASRSRAPRSSSRKRIDDPDRNWKLSVANVEERACNASTVLQGAGHGLSQARCEGPTGTATDTQEARKMKTPRDAGKREPAAELLR